MIIYRVETDDRRGPYGSGPWVQCDNWGHAHHVPGPNGDEGLCGNWNSLCHAGEDYLFTFGFSTPKQLLEWFGSADFHNEAENAGYRVSVVEVLGRVFHGTYQSIFERSKSVVTKRLTFNEIKQLAV